MSYDPLTVVGGFGLVDGDGYSLSGFDRAFSIHADAMLVEVVTSAE